MPYSSSRHKYWSQRDHDQGVTWADTYVHTKVCGKHLGFTNWRNRHYNGYMPCHICAAPPKAVPWGRTANPGYRSSPYFQKKVKPALNFNRRYTLQKNTRKPRGVWKKR